MNMEKKILTDMERIEKNRRIAEAYYAAYDKKAVKDGTTYADWVYASHATYWSPYFGNGMIDLETNPISVEDSATMEALSYSIEFKDWGPIDFECFPSVDGVAWKTHFGAHRKSDDVFMDFFATATSTPTSTARSPTGRPTSTAITTTSWMWPSESTAPIRRAQTITCGRS